MENPAELDHQSILPKARTIKHGKWIERILRQTRKSMTGIGVKDYKDLSDKQKVLPNLTGPTVHGTWEENVFRLASDIMDGKQLAHLADWPDPPNVCSHVRCERRVRCERLCSECAW